MHNIINKILRYNTYTSKKAKKAKKTKKTKKTKKGKILYTIKHTNLKNIKNLRSRRHIRSKQDGGFSSDKTVCAPYMEQNKSIIKAGAVDANNKVKVVENGKIVELIPTVHPNSCMGHNELMTLLSVWNRSYSNEKVLKYNSKGVIKSDSVLWEELKNHIDKHIPDEGEHEWWELDSIKDKLGINKVDKIQDTLYVPEAPDSWESKPTTWLNSLDIEAVLKQYENKYPEFISYGAVPIDFDLKNSSGDCEVNNICNININTLLSGGGNNKKQPKKYIGVIFNLDKHYESGSHWIALFVNIPKGEINYWDSYGYKPPNEVSVLMDKIKRQLQSSKLNKLNDIKIQENTIRHQYKNSECGVYSLHFIIKQLEGSSFNNVCKNKISDDEMNNYRNRIFTNAR
jgi:hypothetical protein